MEILVGHCFLHHMAIFGVDVGRRRQVPGKSGAGVTELIGSLCVTVVVIGEIAQVSKLARELLHLAVSDGVGGDVPVTGTVAVAKGLYVRGNPLADGSPAGERSRSG